MPTSVKILILKSVNPLSDKCTSSSSLVIQSRVVTQFFFGYYGIWSQKIKLQMPSIHMNKQMF